MITYPEFCNLVKQRINQACGARIPLLLSEETAPLQHNLQRDLYPLLFSFADDYMKHLIQSGIRLPMDYSTTDMSILLADLFLLNDVLYVQHDKKAVNDGAKLTEMFYCTKNPYAVQNFCRGISRSRFVELAKYIQSVDREAELRSGKVHVIELRRTGDGWKTYQRVLNLHLSSQIVEPVWLTEGVVNRYLHMLQRNIVEILYVGESGDSETLCLSLRKDLLLRAYGNRAPVILAQSKDTFNSAGLNVPVFMGQRDGQFAGKVRALSVYKFQNIRKSTEA